MPWPSILLWYTSCSCFLALGGVTVAPLAMGGVALVDRLGWNSAGGSFGWRSCHRILGTRRRGLGYDAIGGYAVGWHSADGGGALASYAAFGEGPRDRLCCRWKCDRKRSEHRRG